MESLITLRDALMTVDDAPDDAAVFLPRGEEWRLESRCAVLEVDPYDESEVDPPFALRNGLSHPSGRDNIPRLSLLPPVTPP